MADIVRVTLKECDIMDIGGERKRELVSETDGGGETQSRRSGQNRLLRSAHVCGYLL